MYQDAGINVFTGLAVEGILRDGSFIPADPENRDWQEYQTWIANGNEPEPCEPEPAPSPSDPVIESAMAKLIAGQPLSEEEARAVVGL